MSRLRTATTFALVLAAATLAACGKRGDPLQPLRLIPSPMGDLAARRAAQQVELRFTLPTANANGPGRIDLDRVEIYAVTIGPGAVTPPNRDLLTKARVVGTIAVKPAPIEGAPEPPATDKRPGPGDAVTFVEELTEAKLTPVVLPSAPAEPAAQPAVPPAGAPATAAPPAATAVPPPAAPGQPAAAAPGAAPAAAAPPSTIKYPTRIYVARGLSRSGRPGPPSVRAMVPLVSPVGAPTAVVARMPSEKGVVVDWTPPVAEPGGAPVAFNVYRSDAVDAPLNKTPLPAASMEIPNEPYGAERCYVVRSIQTAQNVTVESEPSAPACLTPLDKFPPAAPKNLRAVAEEGAVSLVWDANSEADLGGYLVLRGDAAGGTLQPVTPEPIKDASYRDTTVIPGVRYAYAVVAVDSATPARNSSPPSAQELVTAR